MLPSEHPSICHYFCVLNHVLCRRMNAAISPSRSVSLCVGVCSIQCTQTFILAAVQLHQRIVCAVHTIASLVACEMRDICHSFDSHFCQCVFVCEILKRVCMCIGNAGCCLLNALVFYYYFGASDVTLMTADECEIVWRHCIATATAPCIASLIAFGKNGAAWKQGFLSVSSDVRRSSFGRMRHSSTSMHSDCVKLIRYFPFFSACTADSQWKWFHWMHVRCFHRFMNGYVSLVFLNPDRYLSLCLSLHITATWTVCFQRVCTFSSGNLVAWLAVLVHKPYDIGSLMMQGSVSVQGNL